MSITTSVLLGIAPFIVVLQLAAQPASRQSVDLLQRKPLPPRPRVATWYSLQRPTAPPLPFNPFPDLPVFALEPGRFAFDDRSINYVELQEKFEAERAISDTLFVPQVAAPTMLNAGIANFRARLDIPIRNGPRTKLRITFPDPDFLPDPLLRWDVYFTPNFNLDNPMTEEIEPEYTWQLYWSGSPGQTEFDVPTPQSESGFWLVAWGNDTDKDGLSDGFEELTVNTDRSKENSDFWADAPEDTPENAKDYLPDAWEVHYGLDPNDHTSPNGNGGNPDGDAYTNLQEFANGTDPMSANEARPRVWIEIIDCVAIEPSNTAQFRIHREGGPTSQALQVRFTLGGTARYGPPDDPDTDYTLTQVTGAYPNLAITIPAGEESVDLTITPKADTLVEGGESMIVALTRDLAHYTIDWTRDDAEAVIHDSNVLMPSLEVGLKVGIIKEGSRLTPEGAPAAVATGLKYVAVACTGRNTVVRINAESGVVVGEYRSLPEIIFQWPPWRGRNPEEPYGSPSRTTVDSFGNIWVGNRADNPSIGNGIYGSATRIGLLVPGQEAKRYRKTDDGGFVEDSQGQYFRGPFAYNTCPDRDGDGFIRTSAAIGAANVLGWANPQDTDSSGGVSSAEDEAILEYVRVPATGVRSIALDRFGDAWIGGNINFYQSKVDSVLGQNVADTIVAPASSPPCGGYGAVITQVGGADVLWSACKTGSTLRMVLEPPYEPACGPVSFGNNYGYGYGIAADPTSGEVWQTLLDPWGAGLPQAGLVRWHPNGTLYQTGANPTVYPHGSATGAKGLTIDDQGEIWVAHYQGTGTAPYGNSVGRVSAGGQSVIKTINLVMPGSTVYPHAPSGVAVGFDGKIWVGNFGDDDHPETDTVMRIDPHGDIDNKGVVDLEVDLNQGWNVIEDPLSRASAYNYSDMTGFNNHIVNPTGVPRKGYWIAVQDGGAACVHWSHVIWTPGTQTNGRLEVSVRASDDRVTLSHSRFQTLLSPGNVDLSGRFLEVRVAFVRVETSDQPELTSLTLTFTP